MEKFIKFLEDNNAWENFERNFIEQGIDVKKLQRGLQNIRKIPFIRRIHMVENKRGTRILGWAKCQMGGRMYIT